MIRTWSTGNPDDNFPPSLLTDLRAAVLHHPWWRARAELALKLLVNHRVLPPAHVLDAGCGWGTNLSKLEQAGYRTAGLDISRQTLELLDGPKRDLIEGDLTKNLPADAGQYDAVMALDVLEHLDDDSGAARRLAELTKPGGLLMISVPARPDLMSEFDRIQGHRRRYIPEVLRAALPADLVEQVEIFWWGSWMVPLVQWQRKRPKAERQNTPTSEIYLEYLRLPRWPIPWMMKLAYARDQRRTLNLKNKTGTSLFAIARRRGGEP